jgi:lipoprotein NlpI
VPDFDQAIRLAPNHAGPYNEREFVRLLREEHDQAIQDYSQVVRLNPDYDCGCAYVRRG